MNGNQDLSREQLLTALDMFAKNWLAHDGCWFLAAEAEKGLDDARERKGLPPFPCKNIGETEFPTFAATIDPCIKTRCLRCPPDAPAGKYCGWEFYLKE